MVILIEVYGGPRSAVIARMMSIFTRSQNTEVGKQEITSLIDFLLFISLISILVDLGVLFISEFELGFTLIFFPSSSLSLLRFLVWLGILVVR